jgi:hypothetical protein
MIRTKLNVKLKVVLFVFVLAAALLPQALFAQSYTVCADEANPQSCIVRQAEQPAAVQQVGPAARATVCADDADPESCIVRSAQPYAARSQWAAAQGDAEADPSTTAGTAGLGQVQATPARHSRSGGYGPHHAQE